MGYLENIDAAYKNAENAANSWAGVNAQAQHDAHLVMQSLVQQRDAYLKSISSSPAPSGGGGGGSPTPPSSPPPPPAPLLPTFRPMNVSSKNFKVAPSDIIQFDDSTVEIALIEDLLFEDIGATELANISRSDLIDGVQTSYSPIKNLPTITREFNPNNIVATSYSTDYFARFGINILLRGLSVPYFNENGDLVIEIEDVADDEEVQVEILQNGTIDMVDVI